jgi:hypothetical protein
MTNSQLFRISGIALIAGAIMFIVHIVARSMITAGTDPVAVATEGLWVPINVLGVVGAVLVFLGLPAMYVRMAGPTGLLGFAGVVLIALAWMFFGLFLSLYSALVMPWLAENAPSLVAAAAPLPAGIITAFIIGLVAQFVGSVLLAIPFLQGHVQPRWIGYTLLASALLAVVGNLIASSGPASNLAINLFSNLGPVLLMVAFGYLGARMWSAPAPAKSRSAAPVVQSSPG